MNLHTLLSNVVRLFKSQRGLKYASLSACTLLLCGFTLTGSNTISWTYFGTPIGTHHYDLTTGRPNITEFTSNIPTGQGIPDIPTGLISRVMNLLPEGRNIASNSQGLLLDTDLKSNLEFSQNVQVWATFLTENAGYRNSLGFFQYNTASPPTSTADVEEKIIFANASMPSALSMATNNGNTVYLGQFNAGTGLGMVMASNGFSATGKTSGASKIPGVKEEINRNWIFYSLRKLNPEPNDGRNLNVHALMFKDLTDSSASYQRIVVAMEDVNREIGGDHDFNDVVIVLHVKSRDAISNLATLPTLPGTTSVDTDGDTVVDELDEFPLDPNKAFTRSYPDRASWGTLAFEDTWPSRGDFDMNDLVLRYRVVEALSPSRQVCSTTLTYRLDARGALVPSTFSVQIPGLNTSSIASASLQVDSNTPAAVTPETGVTETVFTIIPNSALDAPDGGCLYFNTLKGCPLLPRKTYTLSVEFTTPITSIGSPPYNPFIYPTSDRGRETHLPGRQPTSKANRALFNTSDDRSLPGTLITYMDNNRLPWALDIPFDWRYVEERNTITEGYPDFSGWAASSGAANRNWFLVNVVGAKLY